VVVLLDVLVLVLIGTSLAQLATLLGHASQKRAAPPAAEETRPGRWQICSVRGAILLFTVKME
jgi:hypothetical protein